MNLIRNFDAYTAALRDALDKPVILTPAEQKMLKFLADRGDVESQHRLVLSCLRVAVSTAFYFHLAWEIDADASVSAAHLACIKAVRHYDPDRAPLMALVKKCVRNELLAFKEWADSRREQTNTESDHERRRRCGILHRAAARAVGANRERQWRAITDAILALPGSLREVAKLFYLEEFSVRDVAHLLKNSPTTVHKRLDAAEVALRESLRGVADETISVSFPATDHHRPACRPKRVNRIAARRGGPRKTGRRATAAA
ncbi:MAG TPA: sigma-70 family RNA polymerase sigma factor [Pirellulales bacterium]